MVNKIFLFLIIVVGTTVSQAQTGKEDTVKLPDYVASEDSLILSRVFHLKPVTVIENPFTDPADRRMFRLTKYRINKVYPYAMMAIEIMEETNDELSEMEKKRKKKKYLKNEHNKLKDDYAEFLKGFTVEEGRLMIKIIERSTDQPFYDLIKRYRNGMTATYWNTLANIQGYSLKDGYDPEQEKFMEIILRAMED